MRFLAGLLVLANLMLYLVVHRLPALESATPPEINLPRVTRIETLGSGSPASQSREEQGRCFMISGFLAPVGAKNWLLLRGLPLSGHRIIRYGQVDRHVLVIDGSAMGRPSPIVPAAQSALEPFMWVLKAEGKLHRKFLFSDSGFLSASSIYSAENKRSFTLESDRVSFYSYAIVGDEGLRKAWSQRFGTGHSGNVAPESCQGIAKQG